MWPSAAVRPLPRTPAVRALLAELGHERPLALLLDDLHWADEASLELTLHLLRRPPESAQLLVFAARPGAAAQRLLEAALGAPGWEPLTPAPLADEDALRLLDGVADPERRRRIVATRAATRCSCASSLAAARSCPPRWSPPSRSRSPRWSGGARALLKGAAVAGEPFDPELAAAAAALACPSALAALDRLVTADLVRPGEDGRAFAFRHPLVRRAVYAGTAPAWRLTAHERAAAALERRGAAAVVRAHHVERAGGRAIRRPSPSSARPRTPRPRHPRPRRTGTARRCGSSATARSVPSCWRCGRTRSPRWAARERVRGAARSARARPEPEDRSRVRACGDAARPPWRGTPAAAGRARGGPARAPGGDRVRVGCGRLPRRPDGHASAGGPNPPCAPPRRPTIRLCSPVRKRSRRWARPGTAIVRRPIAARPRERPRAADSTTRRWVGVPRS